MNDDRALNCSRCAAPLTADGSPAPGIIQSGTPQYGQPIQPYGQEIPTYMAQSVLVTLLCCMPLGIVGITKANKIKKLIQQNDFAGALKASNENKTMLWIGFGVGFVFTILYIIGSLNK